VSVSKDFEELFASLNTHGVRALIVGGYAYAYHVKPRYTKDIDIWVDPATDNLERLLQALQDFGFGSIGLTVEDFAKPNHFVQLGFPPNRVDLLSTLKGLSFEEAWETRVEDFFGKERVCYLGKEALIRNKTAVGRPQDHLDVAALQDKRAKRRR
jgi:hypothetical protein